MNSNDIYLQDEDEVIGRMPKWMIFRGSSLLLLLAICVLIASYFFKYPTYVNTDVLIQPKPAVYLNSKIPIKIADLAISGSINLTDAGKIKIGQRVFIVLKAYQSNNFGKLFAVVTDVRPMDSPTVAILNFKLLNGLKTNTGYAIPLQPKLYGTGEILVDRIPLLFRIFPFLK